jgi:hypothetical protein
MGGAKRYPSIVMDAASMGFAALYPSYGIAGERSRHGLRYFFPLITETMMTKPVPPIPADNQSHKGPGSAPSVPLDTTKGHRDDEKNNIREQAEHGNMTQNTSNRRSG